MQIENGVFVVTGGGSGLGAATARMLVEAGGRVVLADVNREAGEAIAAELGAVAAFVATDVTDETSAKAWLPLLAAEKPSEFKGWNGIDAAVEGQWDLYAAMQPVEIFSRCLRASAMIG